MIIQIQQDIYQLIKSINSYVRAADSVSLQKVSVRVVRCGFYTKSDIQGNFHEFLLAVSSR